MRLRIIILPLLFLVLTPNLSAQDIDTEKLDAFFDHLETNDQGMGSFSLFKNGEEIFNRSIGKSDMQNNIASGPETIYRIGSITKTFTAALVMQMVEEGIFTLDTRLSEYYPDLPNATDITLEHLLRHRSGLFNFTSAEDYKEWMERPVSKEELLEKFMENGTVFTPGEKFEYSNTNYLLLTYILEDAADADYAELLDRRIAQPCGLANTYYGGAIGQRDHEAFSYSLKDAWEKSTETDMSVPQGAGALVSTPTDINKFLVCLFSGELVSAESLEQMKTLEDGYGLGMFSFPFGERRAFGHNGGIDAFQSSAGYFPEDDLAVTYLANGVNYAVNDIMIGVLSIVYGVDFEFPTFLEIPVEVMQAFEGTYESPEIPIDLKIFLDGKRLFGQGTGQGAFPLSAVNETTYKFDPAGITITFMPEENKMILSQGGGEFEMTRK